MFKQPASGPSEDCWRVFRAPQIDLNLTRLQGQLPQSESRDARPQQIGVSATSLPAQPRVRTVPENRPGLPSAFCEFPTTRPADAPESAATSPLVGVSARTEPTCRRFPEVERGLVR